MLTDNEKKVLKLLMAGIGRDYSINEIAKECGLAPNGALKILKKFENEGILIVKRIANIKSYKINFADEKTNAVLELTLMSKLSGRVKNRAEDLAELREAAKACVIFGSYIGTKKEPNDIDVLFVLDKINYREYKKKLGDVIAPVKIHDIVQTEEDLKENLKKKDKIILEAIRNGAVLWGYKLIVEAVKNAY